MALNEWTLVTCFLIAYLIVVDVLLSQVQTKVQTLAHSFPSVRGTELLPIVYLRNRSLLLPTPALKVPPTPPLHFNY